MKLILFILLVIPLTSAAQDVQIDSCGLDNNSRLSTFEVDYFRAALGKEHIDTLELSSFRVLFLSGNWGAQASSKKHFFENTGKPLFFRNDYPSMELIVLTDKERKKLPEFDALLVTWSKIKCTEKNRKRFINNALINSSQVDE